MSKLESRLGVLFLLLAVLLGCSESIPDFHESNNPQRLSEWNLFALSQEALIPSEASLVYTPANQLFTDYAHKLRTLWVPNESQAQLVNNEINYPVGTVLTKTFYYPTDLEGNLLRQTSANSSSIDLANNKLIETRLLVKRSQGWEAFPYVWNDDQTEAFLRVAGASTKFNLKSNKGNLEFVYFVPNENQCSGCHVTKHPDGEMHPLGAIASQLTSAYTNNQNQTEDLVEMGWLDRAPDTKPPKSWKDEAATTQDRAQAYLNIHCGHCHNPDGAADTSALILDGSHNAAINRGVCKTPVAAGGGAGDMLYSIVPGAPGRSILVYRMESSEPDEMMPELGRSLIHSEGIALIKQWIQEMPGSCPN